MDKVTNRLTNTLTNTPTNTDTNKVVFIRHGQSTWNEENRFTGWTDVDLTDLGKAQARTAAKLISEAALEIDVAYTSVLSRAIKTLWIILEELNRVWIPVHRSWLLNEKHYGTLQGLNKAETAQKYGEEQVLKWRRSYTAAPPLLEDADPRHPRFDPRYLDVSQKKLPGGESLEQTVQRVVPYWKSEIGPAILQGHCPLVAAHGNSLRGLVKYLDNVSDAEIVELNIPTGVPLVYELDDDLKPIRHFYLGDPDQIQREIEAVARQGKSRG